MVKHEDGEWPRRIIAACSKSIESILEVGRLLTHEVFKQDQRGFFPSMQKFDSVPEALGMLMPRLVEEPRTHERAGSS